MHHRKKILISPLNWGLGHATRCSAIIHDLLQSNTFDIILAADGRAYHWLQSAFPRLPLIRLEGIDISYPSGKNMVLKMAASAPGMFFRIFREHRKLQKIIRKYGIDIILSDNRFGLWSHQVPAIFITHQLHIITSAGFGMAERVVNRINHFFIKKFDVCWVPDFPGENNISGSLSEWNSKHIKVRYIGMLSRFYGFTASDIIDEPYFDSDLLVMLSGPEPQRSIFEEMVIGQLEGTALKAIILRGTPELRAILTPGNSHITIFNHLDDHALFTAIKKSKLIISRPGYSTIMDLYHTGGASVFVPTPGQTEQEYLAKRLAQKNIAPWFRQDDFLLQKAIKAAETYKGFSTIPSDTHPDFSMLLNNLFAEREE